MKRRVIATDGLRQSVLEQGEGPLVLLCHGFPELAYSWRAQIPALAGAGFRAVAPDMRGYGAAERPASVEAYSILHLVGDMVDLVRALGETTAVIIGHDWGAQVAWSAAQLRPDVFTAVAALSVPFRPRVPGKPPVAYWRAIAASQGLDEFYMVRFQAPGAEAEFETDVETALLKMFSSYDGSTPAEARSSGFVPEGARFLDTMTRPQAPPPWMTAGDLATYVEAFAESGFAGPLNWYRNLDRNHELTAFAQGLQVAPPALFLTGEHDPVRGYSGRAEAELELRAPRLRGKIVLPGAGHWVQQERPEAVNAALVAFLESL